MAAVLAEQRPRLPRSEQNTPAAFSLALAMHALLVGALWISVQWRTEPSGAVVVELWGNAPEPEPAIVAPPPPPPPVRAESRPEQPKADIVVREEKKPPRVEPPPDTKKIEAERRKAEAEKQRIAAEAKRQELEKKQLEAERKKQAEAAAQAAERKRDDERRAAVRKAEEARVLAQAGTGGGNPNAAPGAGGRGDAGYAGLLASTIKPRIVFAVPEGTSANIYADFEVDLLPTGEILAVRLVKPSGLPGYDAAVERAIRRTDPFPRKADGTVDRTVPIRFRPVEK
jgi:colicin import membrane protein